MICDLNWKLLEHYRKVDSVLHVLHDIREGKLAMPGILPKLVRDSNKFQPLHGRVIAYRDSFIPTTVNWWNKLPNDILNLKDREEFKLAISNYFAKDIAH